MGSTENKDQPQKKAPDTPKAPTGPINPNEPGGAQERSRPAATKVAHKKTQTLTGCLQKADGANEYNLTTGKGGTWEIKSDSVDLAPHVGKTVTVTGVVSNAKMHGMKEDAKEEAKEHGMDKKEKEHGHLTATDVKMVSETCKR